MAGNRLFHLINLLSSAESKKLIIFCRSRTDKRYHQLELLLKKRPYREPEEMESVLLSGIHKEHPKSPEAEKDKKKRRLISFCSAEIENFRIREYLDENSAERSTLLAQIYFGEKDKSIALEYIEKILKQDKPSNNPGETVGVFDRLKTLELAILLLARIQTDESLQRLKELLIERKNEVNALYQTKSSQYIGMISSLFIDDTHFLENHIDKNLDEYLPLVNDGRNNNFKIDFNLARARLNYLDKEKCYSFITEAENILKKESLPKNQKIQSLRKIHFTKFLLGFHHGESAAELSLQINEVLEQNKIMGIPDVVSNFYSIFFTILGHDTASAEKQLEEKLNLFSLDDSRYMSTFLQACMSYAKADNKSFVKQINKLEIHANHYVLIWAKLLEIFYWLRKKDLDYTEVLLERLKKTIQKNSSKKYTLNDTLLIMDSIEEHLQNSSKPCKFSDELKCIFHRWLVEGLGA